MGYQLLNTYQNKKTKQLAADLHVGFLCSDLLSLKPIFKHASFDTFLEDLKTLRVWFLFGLVRFL